jgi:hypothetical protein
MIVPSAVFGAISGSTRAAYHAMDSSVALLDARALYRTGQKLDNKGCGNLG